MAERELEPEHKIKNKYQLHNVWLEAGNEKGVFVPTQGSRRYLYKLSIEVGNDSMTLLRGVHPFGENSFK